jgi:hypothetical protein
VRPGALSADASVTPNPEVLEKPERRRFTAEYKMRILKLADACEKSEGLGALLRRELQRREKKTDGRDPHYFRRSRRPASL